MFLHQNIIPRIFLRGKKAYSHLDSSFFFQFSLHFYIKIIVFYINKMTVCSDGSSYLMGCKSACVSSFRLFSLIWEQVRVVGMNQVPIPEKNPTGKRSWEWLNCSTKENSQNGPRRNISPYPFPISFVECSSHPRDAWKGKYLLSNISVEDRYRAANHLPL